ncbi:MAG: aromatic ring-hydroxylating dioxygenase subunit alpha [Pseudomonadales bacterium]
MKSADIVSEQYNGLRDLQRTLPKSYYIDEAHYKRELDAIWYRSWVYMCRAEDLALAGDFKTITIGSQNIIVLRDDQQALQAFHNTCRHRGSILLTEESGNLGASSRLSCPYHRWSYSLQGNLLRTGVGSCPAGFDKSDYPLYDVSIEEWNGFVYVNLDPEPSHRLTESFDEFSVPLDNWSLADVRRGHVYEKTLNCNWKIFWENFNECLHCPNVHQQLCDIVPLYRRGIMEAFDDPAWQEGNENRDPAYAGGLREGASTWSTDGQARGAHFPNLSEQEINTGHNYHMHMPSMFIVGHLNYVRTMQVLPLGPEKILLRGDWYFPQATLDDADVDIDEIAAFARQVMDEDGYVSELNQKGLHSIAHQRGALMAEEYDVHRFQNWVLEKLAAL